MTIQAWRHPLSIQRGSLLTIKKYVTNVRVPFEKSFEVIGFHTLI